MSTETLEIRDLIMALEEGGRSEGRGLRVTSYSPHYKAKEARLKLIEKLERLERILEDDHLGEDQ